MAIVDFPYKNVSGKTYPDYLPIVLNYRNCDTTTDNNEEFFSEGQTDGGDIRVYAEPAKTTRLGIEIVHYDHTNKEIVAYIESPGTVANNNEDITIERDDAGGKSQPAATASGGSEQVWEGTNYPTWQSVMHGYLDTGEMKNAVVDPNYYSGNTQGVLAFHESSNASWRHRDWPGVEVNAATGTPTDYFQARDTDDSEDFADADRDHFLVSFLWYPHASQPAKTNGADGVNGNILCQKGLWTGGGDIGNNTRNSWFVAIDDTGTTDNFVLYIRDDNGAEGEWRFDFNYAAEDDAWHHFALWCDGTNNPRIWLDGVEQTLEEYDS